MNAVFIAIIVSFTILMLAVADKREARVEKVETSCTPTNLYAINEGESRVLRVYECE